MELSTESSVTADDERAAHGGAAINIEQVLPGFRPWTETYQSAQPLFENAEVARWHRKRLAQRLVAAGALAYLGRYYYHPARAASVFEADAMEAARERLMRAGRAS
jgi:hypothetical protein